MLHLTMKHVPDTNTSQNGKTNLYKTLCGSIWIWGPCQWLNHLKPGIELGTGTHLVQRWVYLRSKLELSEVFAIYCWTSALCCRAHTVYESTHSSTEGKPDCQWISLSVDSLATCNLVFLAGQMYGILYHLNTEYTNWSGWITPGILAVMLLIRHPWGSHGPTRHRKLNFAFTFRRYNKTASPRHLAYFHHQWSPGLSGSTGWLQLWHEWFSGTSSH